MTNVYSIVELVILQMSVKSNIMKLLLSKDCRMKYVTKMT